MHDEINQLAEMPPGPDLCARLAAIEPGSVPDVELMGFVQARARQLAYEQAQFWAALAEVAGRDPLPGLPEQRRLRPAEVFEYAVDEVAAELRWSRRATRRELEHADAVAAVPSIAEALAAGVLDRRRAIVLAGGCADLTEAQAAKLIAEVLPAAGELPASALADRVRRIAVALDPGWAERRYREAIRDRRLIGYLNPDGSTTVSAQYVPPEQAAPACARVDDLARAAKQAGAAATTDELRVEVFLALLDGSMHGLTETEIVTELQRRYPKPAAETPGSDVSRQEAAEQTAVHSPTQRRGVELRVGVGTLMGFDERPGEIAGWGTIGALIARDIAARQHRGEWRFAIVDDDGQLLFDGLTRRRPQVDEPASAPSVGGIVELHVPEALLNDPDLASAHPAWAPLLHDLARQYAEQAPIVQDPAARVPGRRLRRRLEIRHQTCIGVGCNRPATGCEQDHRREYARHGRTDEANLAPACRHHHDLKSKRGWRLLRRDDTTYRWISPLGRGNTVRVRPVSPPLPAPMPRADHGHDRAMKHQPESDSDPPPF